MYNEPIIIRDAKVAFKNFIAAPDNYGNCAITVTLLLTEEQFRDLEAQGVNVQQKEFSNGDIAYRVKVVISYTNKDGTEKKNPPKIVQKSSRGKVILNKDTIGILQSMRIDHIDCEVNPYLSQNSRTGKKSLYANTMYVYVMESILDLENEGVPEVSNAMYENPAENEDDLPF